MTALITQLTSEGSEDLRRLAQMRESVQGVRGTWHVDGTKLGLRFWTINISAAMADDGGMMRDFAHAMVLPEIGTSRVYKMFDVLLTGPGVIVEGAMRGYLGGWGAKPLTDPASVLLSLNSKGAKFLISDMATTRWPTDALLGPPTEATHSL